MLTAITAGLARAAETAGGTLSGRITSATDGAMEGVLVSARRSRAIAASSGASNGVAVTVTAVSDASGHYAFPRGRLEPGPHEIAIRATGYALRAASTVDIAAGRDAMLDLELATTTDPTGALTNAEWLASMPGSDEQKRPLIECMSCHTLERIVRSTFDAAAFYPVLVRMTRYANNSTVTKPQLRTAERPFSEDTARKLAAYLASINASSGPLSFPIHKLPRPKGRATRMLVTEYDLPRKTIAPHDVRTDDHGRVWYSNFVENTLGRLDPATLEHHEYTWPAPKPDHPEGALALEPDGEGNWWLAAMFQTGLVRFDPRTETFRHFPLQTALDHAGAQQSLLMPLRTQLDGKVWTNDVARQAILRLDLASGIYQLIEPFAGLGKGRQHSPYGMVADTGNNLFFMDFADESVGRVDAKSLRATLYPTPTPRSRPRRAMLDANNRIWLAEFAADKIAMFDIAGEAFKEWDVPTPHTHPYDVYFANGEVWAGSMSTDRILRLDPATGATTEYLLPRPTNIRRIFVEATGGRVAIWAGSNHGASIVRLEPLD